MRRTQAEQTVDGDYESIGYHTFKAVDYDRYMAWKAGSGRIGVGVRELTSQKTDEDKEDVLLPAGRSVLVIDTEFKLVRNT
jgi:hypothetical protein